MYNDSSVQRTLLAQFLEQYDCAESARRCFDATLALFLPEIIEKTEPIVWQDDQGQTFTASFSRVAIGRAHEIDDSPGGTEATLLLTPFDARSKCIHYNSHLYMDFRVVCEKENGAQQTVVVDKPREIIGDMPVMLRSMACNMHVGLSSMNEEPAGSFIVGGQTKIMPPLSKLCYNTEFVFESKHPRKFTLEMEVRSIASHKQHASTSNLKIYLTVPSIKNPLKSSQILFSIPQLDEPIAIGILFLALGWSSESIEVTIRATAKTWLDSFSEQCRKIVAQCSELEKETKKQQDREAKDALQLKRTLQAGTLLALLTANPSPPKRTLQENALLALATAMLKRRRLSPSSSSAPASTTKDGSSSSSASPASNTTSSSFVHAGMSDSEKIKYAEDILSNEVLPHAGGKDSFQEKGVLLSMYLWRLFMVGSSGKFDVRDHPAHNRYDHAGFLHASLFRQIWTTEIKSLRRKVQRLAAQGHFDKIDVLKLFHERNITQRFKGCMKSNNWTVNKRAKKRENVVQTEMPINFMGAYAFASRLSTTLISVPKNMSARQVQQANWGLICPSATPEGGQCGLVKEMSMLAIYTLGSSPELLCQRVLGWANELHLVPVSQWAAILATRGGSAFDDYMTLCVANKPLGKFPKEFKNANIEFLREKRRTFCLGDPHVRLSADNEDGRNVLNVQNDAGCLVHPVIIASQYERFRAMHAAGKLGQTSPFSLRLAGIIEYLSAEEEKMCVIATDEADWKRHESYGNVVTHIEIHPSLQAGFRAGCIPDMQHNQSPRNTYQAAMCQQAISMDQHEVLKCQKGRHQGMYGQRPIISTAALESMPPEFQCMGTNVMVGTMAFEGMTVEDAVVTSQGFVDRGGMVSFYEKQYKDVQRRTGSGHNREIFEKPSPLNCKTPKLANYNKIDPKTGIVRLHELVLPGDVVMAKTTAIRTSAESTRLAVQAAILQAGRTPSSASRAMIAALKRTERMKRRDVSIVHKDAPGIVIASEAYQNAQGLEVRRVVIRSVRIPKIGDKKSSRHGQKGTCSKLVPDRDMPWNPYTHMRLDLIINPISFCGRMTIAQINEAYQSKARLLGDDAIHADGTAFEDKRELLTRRVADMLKASHMQCKGYERLRCGKTGRMIDAPVFCAPTFYQRLKHMVDDKMHARADGPRSSTTRQPTEGRSWDGGLRFGEMERDVLISFGVPEIIQNKLIDCSDPFIFTCCRDCGHFNLSYVDFKKKVKMCKNCGTGEGIRFVKTKYAFKLLLQEFTSMNLSLTFELEDTGQELTDAQRIFSHV